MCSNGIGHQECMTQFVTIEHVGHKAAPDSWRNSKNKVYRRKMAKQQNVAGYAHIKRK